jgi:ADP-ribosyltransferase exoenzyme
VALAELVASRLDGLTDVTGDPEALRAAGRIWLAAADAADAAARAHAAAAGLPGLDWSGSAAGAYAGGVAGIDPAAAATAMRSAAAALHVYATELESARAQAARAWDVALSVSDEASRLDRSAGPDVAGAGALGGPPLDAPSLLTAAISASLQSQAAAEDAATATVRAAAAFDHVADLAAHAAPEASTAGGRGGGGVLHWLAGQAAALGKGVWAGVSEPVTQLARLTFGSDRAEAWQAMQAGLEDGAIHPDQFAASMLGLDDLEEHGTAYWVGTAVPGVIGTLLGGTGVLARGSHLLRTGAHAAEEADDLAALRTLGRQIDGGPPGLRPGQLSHETERWVLDGPPDPMAGARTFASKRAAAAWGERHWGEVARSLPPEARDAVEYYTSSGYRAINGHLRGAQGWPGIEHRIALIDEAIARQAVPEDVIVWRGADKGAFAGHQVEDISGQAFTEDGFLSTALGDTEYASKPVLMKLRVPEGTPALYVDPISSFPGERELLLGRGMRYQVHTVSKMGDGRWLVEAEILPVAG